MFVNKVSKDLEALVFQNAQIIKFGKMINVFVLQDIHGLMAHVEPVLKIQNLLKIKLHVFAFHQMQFIQFNKIHVTIVHNILFQIMTKQIVFVFSII